MRFGLHKGYSETCREWDLSGRVLAGKAEEIRRELEVLRLWGRGSRADGRWRTTQVSEEHELQEFMVLTVLGQATEGALEQWPSGALWGGPQGLRGKP